MKTFFAVLAFAAVAYAAPSAEADAEADPALLYSGLGYAAPAWNTWGSYGLNNLAYRAPWAYNYGYNTAAVSPLSAYSYSPYAYGYNNWGFSGLGARVFKREAEAEADAEADPALLYSGLGYASPAYNTWGLNRLSYAASPLAYRAPWAYNYGYNYGYNTAIASPALSAYSYSPFAYGYNNLGFSGLGARLIKRDAEADAEADPALLYSSLGYAAPAYGRLAAYSAPALSYGYASPALSYASPLAYRAPFAYSSYAYNPTFAYNGLYNRAYSGFYGRYFK